MEQQSFISEAEIVASTIARTAKHEMRAVSQLVALRMPVHLLIRIDGMAKHAGKSRSSMIASLVKVGLDEVEKHLGDDTRSELEPLYVDAAAALLPDATEENY